MDHTTQPSPELFFDTITAYQKTAALKAAIDLDLFTALADGAASAAEIAQRCQASPRGIRILCDYLSILGFLMKCECEYQLTPDSAVFLNRKSPAYAGGATEFLLSEQLRAPFEYLASSVRKGGTADPNLGSTAPEHPIWCTFAKAMGGLMARAAEGLAALIPLGSNRPAKVLDIAAGHGVWGIAFARKYPNAHLVALDWAPVLAIARENAQAAGVADRFSTVAGSAFEVDLGSEYDVVLVPNFLHHFSVPDSVRFLKRAHAALRAGGLVAIVEFVPNPDRISPPQAAAFSLIMLATTPEGDAYTFEEYAEMLAQAGFQEPAIHPLPASTNQAIIARK
jgi:predicted O-methyltransferase YrrM